MFSIYDNETDPENPIKYPFDYNIVWKRPKEFLNLKPGEDPKIFSGGPNLGIEPDDIK